MTKNSYSDLEWIEWMRRSFTEPNKQQPIGATLKPGHSLEPDHRVKAKNILSELRKTWAGRVFRCKVTGETFTIPDDVRECDCFFFGDGGMIDVGRFGFYSRMGGDIEEITDTPV